MLIREIQRSLQIHIRVSLFILFGIYIIAIISAYILHSGNFFY